MQTRISRTVLLAWLGVSLSPAPPISAEEPFAALPIEESVKKPRTPPKARSARAKLGWIRVSQDGEGFVVGESSEPFRAWGVNYDHDGPGRLLEEYWGEEWPTVVEDLREIRALGANVVRIHLQVASFMKGPSEVVPSSLDRLSKLVRLAEELHLYLNLTGLGCYHEHPAWYRELGESARWDVQARFWDAIADVSKDSPAIFCYDLMNEPILPGAGEQETEWLTGEFGGKHFVQRISLDLGERSRENVARAWVNRLTAAIRKRDRRHLITVGVIPWVHVFPKSHPIFYSPRVSEDLDFVSVHFYPEKGKVDDALTALRAYEIGKPLVIEEMFPLRCSSGELLRFIDGSRSFTDGWFSFYWGTTIAEYRAKEQPTLGDAITREWLEHFREKGRSITDPAREASHDERRDCRTDRAQPGGR